MRSSPVTGSHPPPAAHRCDSPVSVTNVVSQCEACGSIEQLCDIRSMSWALSYLGVSFNDAPSSLALLNLLYWVHGVAPCWVPTKRRVQNWTSAISFAREYGGVEPVRKASGSGRAWPGTDRPRPAGGVQAVDSDESTVRSASRPLTSDSRNLRCPPGVRMDPMRPADAHRVTVLGSTLNIRATSPGVSSRSGFSTITGDLRVGKISRRRCLRLAARPLQGVLPRRQNERGRWVSPLSACF